MRNFFLKRKLTKAVRFSKRKRIAHNLRTAKNIAILFDASEQAYSRHITAWRDSLEKSGKTIQLLGYSAIPQVKENTEIPSCTSKDFSITGRWNNMALDQFVAAKPNLLVVVNPNDLLPITMLAALSNAEMKAGSPTAWSNDYDLMIEVPANKSVEYFLEQLQFYLDKIHHVNEPARTV